MRARASEIFPASERQYIRASRSERNLEWYVIFRFTVHYNGIAMSVASTEHMEAQSQSGFHCFNTSTQQTLAVSGLPAVSVNYLNLQPSRLVLLGIVIAYTRNIAQNAQKSFAARALPKTPTWELMTLPIDLLVGGLSIG